MRRIIASLAVLAAALAIGIVPAGAVTDGELDGNRHPYVGLMVAQDGDGNPLWRCSGTLLSSTLFLTAGHCTESPAAHIEIWFDADVESGIPGNGYPNNGDEGGTPFTHPQFDPNAFFLHDLGVVVLDAPLVMSEYGVLPALNQLDTLKTKRGKQDVTFTAVGYGLQRINPVFVEAERVRMLARPHLIQINGGIVGDFCCSCRTTIRPAAPASATRGAPNFLGDSNVVAGVTSFGLNGNCAGTGGVYRVDKADDLDWLEDVFGAHVP